MAVRIVAAAALLRKRKSTTLPTEEQFALCPR